MARMDDFRPFQRSVVSSRLLANGPTMMVFSNKTKLALRPQTERARLGAVLGSGHLAPLFPAWHVLWM